MAGDSSFGTNNPFRRKVTASSSSAAPEAPLPSTASLSSTVFLDGESPFQADSPTPTPTPTPASAPAPHHHHHPPLSSHPTGDDFQQLLRALPKSDAPPPSTTFQKKKPVKKVRVQSPPPSSPESAHAVHAYPKYPRPSRSDDEESTTSSSSSTSESLSTGDRDDPFGNAPPGMAEDVGFREDRIEQPLAPAPPQPPAVQVGIGQAPPNPFQKTLEDMERSAKEGDQGTTAAKGGMDVDAFRRLLLTGQGPVPAAAAAAASSPAAVSPSHLHPTGAAGDGGSITDASSISRQSIFDSGHAPQETPRTSHEISEPEAETERRAASSSSTKPPAPPASRKKPPPPPGSRHGKLIKIELKGEEGQRDAAAPGRPGSSGETSNMVSSPTERPSSSDVNKPLPPAPARRSEDEDRESIFDREAAGKVPELDIDPEADVVPSPRPPTPPNASHSSSTPVQNPASTLRKPAPPPRRQPGHARTDSKPPSITGVAPPSVSPTTIYPDDSEHVPPRSSLDSQRSRSSSIRVNISSSAPAPPPPRRPHHGTTRAAASFTSPTAATFPSAATSPSALSDAERSPLGGFAGAHHAHSHLAEAISSPTGSGSDIVPAAFPGTTTLPASISAPHIPHSASTPKLFPPPPPPPARNSSVRGPGTGRPSSVSSFDATSRRVGREGGAGAHAPVPPPPPPRPRTRGGSKGSMDGPGLGGRRTSVDSVRVMGGRVVEEPGSIAADEALGEQGQDQSGRPRSQTNDSTANDILADLDALQREVDAARAMFGK